jgi:uncharacterized protein (TIGR02391 family)
MKTLSEILPPPNELLQLDPEDVAALILIYLNQGNNRQISRHNLLLHSGEVGHYASDRYDEIARAITEAWIVLEKEGLVAPEPNSHGNEWSFITKRGQTVQNVTDFRVFKLGTLLPQSTLNPILALHVRPIFLRGDYDTAVLRAFKEVETQVRTTAGLGPECFGTQLMREAFHVERGRLTDQTQVSAERQAVSDFFAGAVGMFKNPSSHRNVSYVAEEAATLIRLADYLLSFVARRAPRANQSS